MHRAFLPVPNVAAAFTQIEMSASPLFSRFKVEIREVKVKSGRNCESFIARNPPFAAKIEWR
jgi:hypothetical protein